MWKNPLLGSTVLAAAAVALWIWVAVELRAASPLVDLRLIGAPAVVAANGAMLVSGAGMYLLFSLLTRYVQTPPTAGYGFGLPGVLAGAALIPFSAFGFAAGRLISVISSHFSGRWAYLSAAAAVMVAAALFAVAPDSWLAVLVAMAVLGLGVGGVSAVMPRLVLVNVPKPETASVLLVNQIIRSIGFGVGSAMAGMLLAASTSAGALLPNETGYVTAALWVLPLLAISVAVILPASTRAPFKRG